MTTIKRKLYNLIRNYRWNWVKKTINKNSKSILDIGCYDLFFSNNLKKMGYEVTSVDLEPRKKEIQKQSIENLTYKDNSFDITLCLEVLEHTKDPVKAISELKRVAKNQLIISVPYEPFFTLFRFLTWEKTHLWAITPKALKANLGEPSFEKKLFFKRYYYAVWDL
ncbi:MAG: class I SAM-dependent methyltransferase [Candidatus Woesearchaeota archaeon]|jgi:2-polyprenyl-3-methyl-5-hydroxy-6-metoxy-1,4-benzoquinol methylase|nr:class I SAM-dependent methyltransferase [Candidatus Woesearchaeota archaeon]MDP7323604.1 class I SAM-dependent methyltransferase [Candidatus Woesearchaeota archaeon]|tara:strand:- start:231 stop:728 length:498 start_codon:yes stop_codon:yes gene_type:complete